MKWIEMLLRAPCGPVYLVLLIILSALATLAVLGLACCYVRTEDEFDECD